MTNNNEYDDEADSESNGANGEVEESQDYVDNN